MDVVKNISFFLFFLKEKNKKQNCLKNERKRESRRAIQKQEYQTKENISRNRKGPGLRSFRKRHY